MQGIDSGSFLFQAKNEKNSWFWISNQRVERYYTLQWLLGKIHCAIEECYLILFATVTVWILFLEVHSNIINVYYTINAV